MYQAKQILHFFNSHTNKKLRKKYSDQITPYSLHVRFYENEKKNVHS